MADVFSKKKRSDIMSRVKSRGNRSTELALIDLMKRHRIVGWRRNSLKIGRPDFVFQQHKLAVFVDGCFWHGCSLHGSRPMKNAAFWREKLQRNLARDQFVNRELQRRGWRVMRIWQHELSKRNEGLLLARLLTNLGLCQQV
jgi:DNA mismatch endonuclease (patch repair protein)